jgi:hypothetical protein
MRRQRLEGYEIPQASWRHPKTKCSYSSLTTLKGHEVEIAD